MSKRTRAAAFGAAATALAAGLGAYPVFFRRWCLTWGARPDEVSRKLPGDELLPTCTADNLLTFGGTAVRAIIPIPSITGNVTVTFAAASYAGTLRITILSDPARMPDAPALAAALRHEMSAPLIAPLP